MERTAIDVAPYAPCRSGTPAGGAHRRSTAVRQALPAVAVHRLEVSMVTILIVILLLMALGALPAWPHSRGWGWGPSGGLGLVFVILIVLLLTGRI